jgi:arylformamidase
MKIRFNISNTNLSAELNKPIDISLPLQPGGTLNCFYAPPLQVSPVRAGDFIGSVKEGGLVNFFNVQLNPHGNGTHTECVGHISREGHTLNQCLRQFASLAQLVTIPLAAEGEDLLITRAALEKVFKEDLPVTSIIIRTLPNQAEKKTRNYSGTNPPYMQADAMHFLVEKKIEHLLLDLPSVDRETDGGALTAHHIFWNYPAAPRLHATITELIFVPDEVTDGFYLLHHQITSLELDASPSKPVLYRVERSF